MPFLIVPKNKAELVIMAVLHPNSPKEVLARIVSFQFFFSFVRGSYSKCLILTKTIVLIITRSKLYKSKYQDAIVLPSKNSGKFQVDLDSLNDSVGCLG